MTILPLTYLGNTQYYARLVAEPCVIDLGEHFVKQSFRSRCEIAGANGRIALTVPVIQAPNDVKCSVKDCRIDNSKRWQHNHWHSICSAYRSAPYFDHYIGRFEPFFTAQQESLRELNMGLMECVLDVLKVSRLPVFSEAYIDPEEIDPLDDLRAALSPKPRLHRPDPHFVAQPYYQVFQKESTGFLQNLSILDLIFNEGPVAREVLEKSYLP